ncbi:MAG TPA: FAD-dependent oxidoreductase, partial [Egibacteraceae bacterium]|nr:FAD-dependent oxidoreductase [Egibacteraceae bacterium]
DWTVPRPDGYARWRDEVLPGWPGPRFAFAAPDPKTGATRRHTFTPNPPGDPAALRVDLTAEGGADELWTFRRIAARGLFEPGAYPSDLTLVNWPMVDYTDGPVHGGTAEQDAAHLDGAKRLSLAFLHWLQTEAPRPDGGTGWPGLRPEPEATGTPDGFAKAAYIRESRRIRALHTVTEQQVALDARGDAAAVAFPDSVGIGAYRIDLHPSTGGDGYLDVGAAPFAIPLGALLPVRLRNLLPAAKNLGTTHITNGCYRLHPVEWNVGEAAGRLAAHCLARGLEPRQVRADPALLAEFQDLLRRTGVELEWPSEVRGY